MLKIFVGITAGCALAWSAAAAAATGSTAAPVVREWKFLASLDGRDIGHHTFRVTDRGGEIEVDSRASFDVRFLGFSVYTYEHEAKERWKDGCLAALDSRTDDNGEVEVVTGALAAEGFSLTRRGATTLLPACTMTFAYWNPAMRRQDRLLNPQNGEYLDVSIDAQGAARLGSAEANRYAIRARDLEINLWYEVSGDRWLALESSNTGGGIVSYRLATESIP